MQWHLIFQSFSWLLSNKIWEGSVDNFSIHKHHELGRQQTIDDRQQARDIRGRTRNFLMPFLCPRDQKRVEKSFSTIGRKIFLGDFCSICRSELRTYIKIEMFRSWNQTQSFVLHTVLLFSNWNKFSYFQSHKNFRYLKGKTKEVNRSSNYSKYFK